MRKNIILLCFLALTQTTLLAQNEADRAFIKRHTNTKALIEISKKAKNHYLQSLNSTINLNVKKIVINNQNEIGYLSGFDRKGNPVYDFEDNLDLAITSRINKIWTGGSSGLNLTGENIEIGHWEAGGLALTTHQELEGRITHAENEPVTSHATHTAGTMIGTGIENDARGIASKATIISRRSNNVKSELADFAITGGIISNHSYSRANPKGNTPLYGVYTYHSQDWDDLLFNAPYLTVCKSAGNNRNDTVNVGDNGYDLIYTIAAAKNLLTIGAVHDVNTYYGPQSVNQSSFSNWGPTDDWRIKPDLVANGISVYSANNNHDADYINKSGTSMSTPAVAGAVTLLQEHYHNENGVYMKSATVRALLIGTTDEAGDHDGPDFKNGWGLMNVERAAEVISNNGVSSQVKELTLNDEATYTTTFTTGGTLPMSATIAWTDPAGTAISGAPIDDQTPMLINDLDLRITNGSQTYKPWTMNPNTTSNNFTDAAIKGDNYRDNIERIDVKNLPAGTYTVTVTHKNSLVNGFQNFSLVINGIPTSQLSTQEIDNENNSILVYPNPSEDGYFNVTIPENINADNYNIKVFNTVGKLITDEVHHEKQVSLNLSHLDTGMFIMHIEANRENYKKLILVGK